MPPVQSLDTSSLIVVIFFLVAVIGVLWPLVNSLTGKNIKSLETSITNLAAVISTLQADIKKDREKDRQTVSDIDVRLVEQETVCNVCRMNCGAERRVKERREKHPTQKVSNE